MNGSNAMNCRQAKADIALWIGEDLTDRSRREDLRRHVSACAGCRRHYKRLKGALQVLEHADQEQTYDVSDSVWPELARRIEQQSQPGSRPARFNGWLPFVAMTAACVALVFVMETQGPSTQHLGSDPIGRSFFDLSYLFPNWTQPDSPRPSRSGDRPAAGTFESASDAAEEDQTSVETDGASVLRATTLNSF